ncbi:MAG TPA: hypothetical protein O0X99_00800 [Methanocorpusculum sp.]|nr:hypothetical protein [Methanocorpusculum sp.]HJJ56220.1 hypothetical protein [Methanocorpusculum sp.]
MVNVKFPDGTSVTVSSGTVDEILAKLELNPYEYLVTCDGELLINDEFVEDNKTLVLVSIVHGG